MRDERALKRVDDRFWATERDMFKSPIVHAGGLLVYYIQAHSHTDFHEVIDIAAEDCCILEYRIQ